MTPGTWAKVVAIGLSLGSSALAEAAGVATHPTVAGEAVARAEVASGDRPTGRETYTRVDWATLGTTRIPRGPHLVRILAPASSEALELAVCAGRGRVWVDGAEIAATPGSLIVPLAPSSREHAVVVAIAVSEYERRIACGAAPRAGSRATTRDGLGVLAFDSAHADKGGGQAVVFVPPGHDATKPAAVLVGAHPWNGSIWTYAAYAELLHEASVRDVVLLLPSGLGNSLYTADAEDEVLAAMDALAATLAVDPLRVSIWGASMGGAGATTIGLHHPDRFATVTSFFGDSKYDLATYVKPILHDEAGAHLVNALDIVDNARSLPVWLIHGARDRVSPIDQSTMLARALTDKGFRVRFDRIADAGHEGALVAHYAAELVDLASTEHAPGVVPRVTYRSVRASDTGAYGVRFERAHASGDAYVDLERRADGVHVLAASGVTSVTLARGAFGFAPKESPAIVREPRVTAIVAWDPLPAAEP